MPYLLARHKVEDYAKWKAAFDEYAADREAASSKGGYVFRNVNDPNEVVVLLEYDDLEKARQRFPSMDSGEGWQGVGVVDQPDIYFLDEADRPSV
jgi:hypothetical protein